MLIIMKKKDPGETVGSFKLCMSLQYIWTKIFNSKEEIWWNGPRIQCEEVM